MQQLNLWASGDNAAQPIPSHGLIVHRASRTERLAGWLAENLQRTRPSNPLQAQTIVVGHAGLGRWLMGFLARGAHAHGNGIAANFDMLLPWEWLQRTAQRVLAQPEPVGAYRRELLRWHVFAALPQLRDAQLAEYLSGADAARRRFQLAEHMAGVFEQYLIYRPEWILGWERDARPADWQAQLWRRVHEAIGLPHRAQWRGALLDALSRQGDGEAQPLHVFGVSHLAPDVLAALRAAALWRSVHVYFPDPCREHWVYFKPLRQQLRLADAQAQYFEVGHPLLASLGRMAQDFCIALDDDEHTPVRDEADEAESEAHAACLLAAVQSSLRCAAPELIGAAAREAFAALPPGSSPGQAAAAQRALQLLHRERADASLRVHACHTRLRELEVLRDALLGFLADDPTLAHGDIVVMAPDISAYAASLPAVFGAPARHESDPAHVPWHLADVTLARSHPLLSAFQRVLDLGESRFTLSEVMDFLDVPALARRFGIDAAARAQIELALRRARVAWGLDATMKMQAGAAPVAANSWEFGFDRLYAGYLLGDDAGADVLGILAASGVNGSVAEALGRMDELLQVLRETRDGFMQPRPLTAWSIWLRRRIDALFREDFRDDAEAAALAALQRVVAALQEQGDAAGRDAPLPWSVMRDVVRGAVDTASERQPFLYGGVTFCGLVPQRSIPFRVVCLLGMNEGEFPRAVSDAGINRMLEKPRRGDRDTRNEDRYLFLEALMSARQHLHVSYIGTDVRSAKTRNPAAPLAELLQLLDDQHALAGRDEQQWPRPWLVRHPLQPFDARYYAYDNERDDAGTRHDPRLFSYTSVFADIPAHATQQARPVLTFDDTCAPAAGDENSLSLSALKRFWRDPAKAVLRDNAGVSLQAFSDDALPDREPLDASADRRERVELQLVLKAIESGQDIPAEPPAWLALSGMLASGAAGRAAYEQARIRAGAALDELRILHGAQRAATTVEVPLRDGRRLSGKVEDVYCSADGVLHLFGARLTRSADFGDLVPFFIDWAALVLGGGAQPSVCFVENATRKNTSYKSVLRIARPPLIDVIAAQTREQLQHGLHSLMEARETAHAQPLLFPAKTAWAWAGADAARRDFDARTAWLGGFNITGERDFGGGYANLLARNVDFVEPDSTAHARFAGTVELVARVLDPQRRILLPVRSPALHAAAEESQDDA